MTILRYDSLDSTNTEAARQARFGASEGLCVVARQQTRGRGRRQRAWISPLDAGLYFSIILRPRSSIAEWPLVTLMAAVAVSDALRDAYALETDVKWPNDILFSGKKLCGILAETVESEPARAVVLGIGINLRQGGLPLDLHDAVSVEACIGREPNAEDMLKHLTGAIESRYSTLQESGGAVRITEEWERRSSYAQGMRVRVSPGGQGDQVFEGITRGLEPDGSLRVEAAGQIRIVRAGDVSAVRRSANDG